MIISKCYYSIVEQKLIDSLYFLEAKASYGGER